MRGIYKKPLVAVAVGLLFAGVSFAEEKKDLSFEEWKASQAKEQGQKPAEKEAPKAEPPAPKKAAPKAPPLKPAPKTQVKEKAAPVPKPVPSAPPPPKMEPPPPPPAEEKPEPQPAPKEPEAPPPPPPEEKQEPAPEPPPKEPELPQTPPEEKPVAVPPLQEEKQAPAPQPAPEEKPEAKPAPSTPEAAAPKKEEPPAQKEEPTAAPAPQAGPAAPKWYDNIKFSGGITTVFQGSSGNTDASDPNSGDSLDYSNSVDIGIESQLAEGHRVVIALESGFGGGLTGRVGTSTFRPNYDAYPTTYNATTNTADSGGIKQGLTVSQAYYEATLSDGQLVLMVGRMDCHSMYDTNDFANNEKAQFMGGPFVRLAGALTPELGKFGQYYASGVTIMFHPSPLVDFLFMAANGEPSKMGNGGHIVGQINLKPNYLGRNGNYRFYFLKDSRTYQTIDPSNPSRKSNSGMGVSFDQYLTDNMGLFFRYGQQDAKIQIVDTTGTPLGLDPLESVTVIGAHFEGRIWGKEKDHAGIGYAVGRMKGDVLTYTHGNAFSGDETMVEGYYHHQVLDGLSLSPDIQLHTNLPRATAREYIAVAVRMQIDF